ncbi:MAG TPA: hypothetical protein VJL83_04055 [Patescibacteria group bacterium]|nr:hypothetical protein [Patescibacteria group bacterium]
MQESIAEKKLKAAIRLMTADDVSQGTFEDIRTLVKGIDKHIDEALAQTSDAIKMLKELHKKDVISLSERTAKELPEHTDEQKKRKKALLFFLTNWKKLRGEIKRAVAAIESQKEQSTDSSSHAHHPSALAKLYATAKGPLGLITVLGVGIAAGIVALKSTAREITIVNDGCGTLTPQVELPVQIPGIELPTQSINDGESALAKLPPLSFSVDGTNHQQLTLRALNFTLGFELDPTTDVLFNGTSLVGKNTTVNLGERKEHMVVIRCQNPQR